MRSRPHVVLAGLCTLDLVQRVAEIPAPGEKTQALDVRFAAGGPATNAAVGVAALGGRATLLTVLGAHPLAGHARTDLREHGVDLVDLLPEHPEPPPLSAVTVREADGERTVVSGNAAATPAVRPPDTLLPDDVDVLLVDGHHPELALAAARRAVAAGIPVVLDAGSWKPVFDELLPMVSVAACSAQFRGPDPRERGVPVAITTAGPDPVRWSAPNGSGAVPVPSVRARDTLGAGDVWHGALAYAVGRRTLGTEPDVPALIEFANGVAAERVRHSGPRAWVRPVRERGEE